MHGYWGGKDIGIGIVVGALDTFVWHLVSGSDLVFALQIGVQSFPTFVFSFLSYFAQLAFSFFPALLHYCLPFPVPLLLRHHIHWPFSFCSCLSSKTLFIMIMPIKTL
ncbi:hypothetical protein DFH27DRAFT_216913 [Peziza echinospora]|nr:hypothetical protein DFH27DRAFT_216913 [Peziza echinospora]